jgi:hypothetical protein
MIFIVPLRPERKVRCKTLLIQVEFSQTEVCATVINNKLN